MHSKRMFDRGKMIKNISGGYIVLCLPPFNSNFLYVEIKPLEFTRFHCIIKNHTHQTTDAMGESSNFPNS